MEEMGTTNLKKVFVIALTVSAFFIFTVYAFAGFEIAILFALVWFAAVVATTAVEIENAITVQLEILHQHLKGYLLDMYAEMIKKN